MTVCSIIVRALLDLSRIVGRDVIFLDERCVCACVEQHGCRGQGNGEQQRRGVTGLQVSASGLVRERINHGASGASTNRSNNTTP